MRKLACIVALLCSAAWAQTIRDVACSQTAVANAITASASGDTVRVASGTCALTVTIPNTKGITLQGGFGGVTTITTASGAVTVNAGPTSPGSRVTGFTFTGAGDVNVGVVFLGINSTSATPRLDNNNFSNAANGGTFVVVQGLGSALLDHNTYLGAGAGEFIHVYGAGAGDNSGWSDNITPGSANMVFIEDNTAQTNNTTFFANLVQQYYGSRVVVRHNILKYCQIDAHGNVNPKARWWEIYSNTFFPMGRNQSNYMQIRGGTGLVYGNTVNTSLGGNSGAGAIQFWEESGSTWPMAFQIGSGFGDTTNGHPTCNSGTVNDSPVYAWANDAAMSYVYTGPVAQNRDVFVSANQPLSLSRYQSSSDTRCVTTYSYTPYTYPHPLAGGGIVPSSTPSPAPAFTKLERPRLDVGR